MRGPARQGRSRCARRARSRRSRTPRPPPAAACGFVCELWAAAAWVAPRRGAGSSPPARSSAGPPTPNPAPSPTRRPPHTSSTRAHARAPGTRKIYTDAFSSWLTSTARDLNPNVPMPFITSVSLACNDAPKGSATNKKR